MTKLKKVAVDEAVPLRLSVADRDLILAHTYADQELTAPLEAAKVERSTITVRYALWELEELEGHIAAAANHTANRKLRQKLDDLYDRIERVETSYVIDDSSSPHRKSAT
jgi:hypothetical protein